MNQLLALAILTLTMIAAPARAEDKPAAPPAPPPSVYFLAVDQADLNLLSAAINELPKKLADPLFAKLQGQIGKQTEIIDKAKAASAPIVSPARP